MEYICFRLDLQLLQDCSRDDYYCAANELKSILVYLEKSVSSYAATGYYS
jgi:hypothetical protein